MLFTNTDPIEEICARAKIFRDMAFIIPDSLFDAQNERLRKFLVEKTQIKVIARLGEKIFDEVTRLHDSGATGDA